MVNILHGGEKVGDAGLRAGKTAAALSRSGIEIEVAEVLHVLPGTIRGGELDEPCALPEGVPPGGVFCGIGVRSTRPPMLASLDAHRCSEGRRRSPGNGRPGAGLKLTVTVREPLTAADTSRPVAVIAARAPNFSPDAPGPYWSTQVWASMPTFAGGRGFGRARRPEPKFGRLRRCSDPHRLCRRRKYRSIPERRR